MKKSGLSSPRNTACVPWKILRRRHHRPHAPRALIPFRKGCAATVRISWSICAEAFLRLAHGSFAVGEVLIGPLQFAARALELGLGVVLLFLNAVLAPRSGRSIPRRECQARFGAFALLRHAPNLSAQGGELVFEPLEIRRDPADRALRRLALAPSPAAAACFSSMRRSSVASSPVICSSSVSVSCNCVSAMRSFSSDPATSAR